VFYVTDLTNAKVATPQRQATIRRALLEVFSADAVTGETDARVAARA
jgi:[protein-PII] uridylyltransferase